MLSSWAGWAKQGPCPNLSQLVNSGPCPALLLDEQKTFVVKMRKDALLGNSSWARRARNETGREG